MASGKRLLLGDLSYVYTKQAVNKAKLVYPTDSNEFSYVLYECTQLVRRLAVEAQCTTRCRHLCQWLTK
jgi:hypothetical protein